MHSHPGRSVRPSLPLKGKDNTAEMSLQYSIMLGIILETYMFQGAMGKYTHTHTHTHIRGDLVSWAEKALLKK